MIAGVDAFGECDESEKGFRKYKDKSCERQGGETRIQTFSMHGRVGDDLDGTKPSRIEYCPLTAERRTVRFKISITKEPDVFWVGEEGVKTLASISVPLDMSFPYKDRAASCQYSFGGPEVRCTIFEPDRDTELGSVPVPVKFHE